MIGLGFAFLGEFLLCGMLFDPAAGGGDEFFQLLLLSFNSILMIDALSKAMTNCEGKELNKLLVYSFLLHLIILLWDIYCRGIYVLPNAEGDALGYHSMARSYAFGALRSTIDLSDYAFYVGLLYRLIGAHRITAQFINIYFAMCSIVMVAKTTYLLRLDREIRKTAVKLVCFLPNLLLISSILLQEAFVAFCIMASVYCFTKWWCNGRSIDLIVALAVSIAGAMLHVGGLVAALGILMALPYINKGDRTLSVNSQKIVLSVIYGCVGLGILSTFGEVFFDKTGGNLSIDSIMKSSGLTDRLSDADYLIGNMGMVSVLGFIVLTPIRMLYFVSSPLPWMWRGIADIIAFFGSAIFYIATARLAWVGMRKADASNPLQSILFALVIVLLIAGVMFGWGVSNTGTALRHREKFTYVCAVAYAVSQSMINGKSTDEDH